MAEKLLALISGGIDSPVASYLMHEQEYELEFIFFYPEPYMNPKNLDLVEKMIKRLCIVMKKKSMKLHIVQHGPVMQKICSECPPNIRCILCRRMMFRIATTIARKQKCLALLTGENLAQVASQTLPNMILEHSASSMIVLTPLLGYDKKETIAIAEKIGTFEIAKEHSCCGLVPDSPRTRGNAEEIEKAEKSLDIEAIVSKAVESVKDAVIDI